MSFTKIARKQYEKLEVGFPLPPDLEQEIQSFLDYLNNSETIMSEDCYRSEIEYTLNYYKRERTFTAEQLEPLYDYYVRGGLYKENP